MNHKQLLLVAQNGLNGCFICHKDLASLLPIEKAREQLSPFVKSIGKDLLLMQNATDLGEFQAIIQDFHKTMEELGIVARQNNASNFFWSAMGTLEEYVVCDVEKKISNI